MNRRLLIAITLVIGCAVAGPVLFVAFSQPPLQEQDASIQNIIVMIGDGMGKGQVDATRLSLGSTLHMDRIPGISFVETYAFGYQIADSAAAGTALACGERTSNGFVAMTPRGKKLTTILEFAESHGKSTGLVTTCRVSHATPATFAAHTANRDEELQIAEQMLDQDIEVLLGGGREMFSSVLDDAEANGYVIVETRDQLQMQSTAPKLLGLFAPGHLSYENERDEVKEPPLAEMTSIAIQSLNRTDKGFFLMVEGGRIDHACHANDLNNTIGDTRAFDEAVGVALRFAEVNNQTLLIVTADHETGGLMVNSSATELDFVWTSTDHTSDRVPVLVYSPDPSIVPKFQHLTDISTYLFQVFGEQPDTRNTSIMEVLSGHILSSQFITQSMSGLEAMKEEIFPQLSI